MNIFFSANFGFIQSTSCIHNDSGRVFIADIAKFSVVVLSADDLKPIEGVQVHANFWENNGWKAWTQAPHVDIDQQTTDNNGFCRLKGKTNCGNGKRRDCQR